MLPRSRPADKNAQLTKKQRTEVETGSQAETLLKSLGYQEIGRIPGWSITQSGRVKDETILYKTLDHLES